jgi:hypothetical protein
MVRRIKDAFDHIIMRHIHTPPFVVVIVRCDGVGNVAELETPIMVQRNHFARGIGRQRRKAQTGKRGDAPGANDGKTASDGAESLS